MGDIVDDLHAAEERVADLSATLERVLGLMYARADDSEAAARLRARIKEVPREHRVAELRDAFSHALLILDRGYCRPSCYVVCAVCGDELTLLDPIPALNVEAAWSNGEQRGVHCAQRGPNVHAIEERHVPSWACGDCCGCPGDHSEVAGHGE